jgi:glycosyltransferase involved in cell wall biosynthesis
MRFSVCIPTVRPTRIEHAIRSILRQTFTDWELVVVGQGDEADMRAVVEATAAGDERVRFVHLPTRGLSIARNAGIAAAVGEIVAFTDDDCEAAVDWLVELDRCFDEDIGLVSGSLIAPPKVGWWYASCPYVYVDDVTYDPAVDGMERAEAFQLMGANIAIRRSDVDKAGGFDEFLGAGAPFAGGEEHDYVFRLAEAGVLMRSSPKVVVRHTYGWRYGLRAVWQVKRDRFRGNAALAAKGLLAETPDGGLRIRAVVIEHARAQLSTMGLARLPFGFFRQFFYLPGYRKCLRDYALGVPQGKGMAFAVLVPRADADRTRTSAIVEL